MYLQLACNVAAVGDDGIDRQIQFVGNRLVGHAFYDAGNDFLFTLAERFLFAVFLIFFFGMEKTVDFCGNHFDIVTDGDAFVILFQRVIVDDGTYQCDVFDTVSVMVCLERGQVEPTAESRVYDYNIGSVQMYKVLQCFR